MRAGLTALFVLAALLFAPPARADYARITAFKSEVVLRADGVLDVTETISIIADGAAIRRGIIRSFPTDYEDWWGFAHTVRFDVQTVTRDGQPDEWTINAVEGGKELQIGRESVFLSEGPHIYVIRYLTDRQVGFFDDHDELYWNVTGNGWQFGIEAAEAVVTLPGGAVASNLAAYTGAQGETGSDATIGQPSPGRIEARTTAPLPFENGLTIGISFPKGFVMPPSLLDRIGRLIGDNPGGFVALIGLALLWLYYLYGRWRYDTGAEPGIVVPLFDPPADLSPSDARVLTELRFDDTAFAATILNLAACGYLKIDRVNDDTDIRVTRTEDKTDARGLPEPEQSALKALFAKRKSFTFAKDKAAAARKIYTTVNSVLDRRHKGDIKRFDDRSLGCLLIVIATIIAVFFFTSGWANWLIVIAVIVAMIIVSMLIDEHQIQRMIEGQKKLDQVEGLKMYLGTAEQERWNALHPPELTMERFERLFPYALALGVEQTWSEHFQRELKLRGGNAETYTPSFYTGSGFSLASTSSFTSSMTRSVTPPPPVSSSGSTPGSSSYSSGSGGYSGGGGFSGGGGGGGGGRGW
ncbi:MAG: DUF2207 domain-containing protein [Alphaproteobacteria bacterium]|nr:DUF2207 domain-containing protein [Alphaproteobacteria bacterium]